MDKRRREKIKQQLEWSRVKHHVRLSDWNFNLAHSAALETKLEKDRSDLTHNNLKFLDRRKESGVRLAFRVADVHRTDYSEALVNQYRYSLRENSAQKKNPPQNSATPTPKRPSIICEKEFPLTEEDFQHLELEGDAATLGEREPKKKVKPAPPVPSTTPITPLPPEMNIHGMLDVTNGIHQFEYGDSDHETGYVFTRYIPKARYTRIQAEGAPIPVQTVTFPGISANEKPRPIQSRRSTRSMKQGKSRDNIEKFNDRDLFLASTSEGIVSARGSFRSQESKPFVHRLPSLHLSQSDIPTAIKQATAAAVRQTKFSTKSLEQPQVHHIAWDDPSNSSSLQQGPIIRRPLPHSNEKYRHKAVESHQHQHKAINLPQGPVRGKTDVQRSDEQPKVVKRRPSTAAVFKAVLAMVVFRMLPPGAKAEKPPEHHSSDSMLLPTKPFLEKYGHEVFV